MTALQSLAPQRLDTACRALPSQVQLFCVGGAVRDHLLGETSSDRDYLVVGASPDLMRTAGFRPVGKDFPVFLHPETQAEYALARTERKSGLGYHGFVFHAGPEVSLEEDLLRRDLTINAMAVDEAGQLHDPYGGQHDLAACRLAHVSPAFREDPVRLLRLARFLARWPAFQVAPETETLCRDMVSAGEASALVAERVWQEMSRGLMGPRPSQMLAFLTRVGAWAAVCQSPPPTAAGLARLDQAAALGLAMELRAGLLLAESPASPLLPVLPKTVQDWLNLMGRGLVERLIALLEALSREALSADDLLDWVSQTDLFRRPERLTGLLALAQLMGGSDLASKTDPRDPRALDLQAHIEALLALPVGPLAQAAAKGGVAEAVAEGRRTFLQSRLAESTRKR